MVIQRLRVVPLSLDKEVEDEGLDVLQVVGVAAEGGHVVADGGGVGELVGEVLADVGLLALNLGYIEEKIILVIFG